MFFYKNLISLYNKYLYITTLMKFFQSLLNLLFTVWKYFLLFLIAYFGVVIFLWQNSPELIQSYFELKDWIGWDRVIFTMRMNLKNIALLLVYVWFFLSLIWVWKQLWNEKWIKWKLIVLWKILFLFFFGILWWYILLKFDKESSDETRQSIHVFVKFWILILAVQLSWFISAVWVDLLMMLKYVGVWVGSKM